MQRSVFPFILSCLIVLSVSSGYAQTWTKVDAGGEFSIALSSDGSIWVWGSNTVSQLGIGNSESQEVPVRVGNDYDWADIAAGGFHVIAQKTDGTLWAWGLNALGQVGNGSTENVSSPIQISSETDWVAIDANQLNSLALKADGSVWAWGSNYYGACGSGSTEDMLTVPTKVTGDNVYTSISCGGYHSLAIASDGTLWGWGYGANGQLIDENSSYHSTPIMISSDTWAKVHAGFEFSSGIKTDNSLWTWGFNVNCSLGDGTTTSRFSPFQVFPDSSWSSVTAGSAFAVAQTTNGTYFGWGFNSGALGLGSINTECAPVELPHLQGYRGISLADGITDGASLYGFHLLAINDNGTQICGAGANYIGQLGNGSNDLYVTSLICPIDIALNAERIPVASVRDIRMDIYPNPVTDKATLTFSASAPYNSIEYHIFDMLGSEVSSGHAMYGQPVPVRTGDLPEGVYTVVAKTRDGRVSTKPFVIAR